MNQEAFKFVEGRLILEAEPLEALDRFSPCGFLLFFEEDALLLLLARDCHGAARCHLDVGHDELLNRLESV